MSTKVNTKNGTSIITRKIRLDIDLPKENQEELDAAYHKLYSWQNIAYKAANIITSHLYCQQSFKEFIYLKDSVKLRLSNYLNDKDGMLNTSSHNSTYRVVSNKFKYQLPSDIMTCINHSIISSFKKEISEYNSGNRSLRTYKKKKKVIFDSRKIFNLRYDNEIKNFRFFLFKDKKYSIPFKTYLGKDYSNNKIIIERCISGEYKLCNSSYNIIDGKIFLYLTVEVPNNISNIDSNKEVEASLSFLAPIIVSINNKESYIGNKESYIYKRQAIQQGLRRRKKLMKFNKGGKGRTQKMKGIDEFKQKEMNFIDTLTHKLSHDLIKFCINNSAGKLVLINIKQSVKEAKENPLVLRNWSFGDLIRKIEYKCKRNGIELITEAG